MTHSRRSPCCPDEATRYLFAADTPLYAGQEHTEDGDEPSPLRHTHHWVDGELLTNGCAFPHEAMSGDPREEARASLARLDRQIIGDFLERWQRLANEGAEVLAEIAGKPAPHKPAAPSAVQVIAFAKAVVLAHETELEFALTGHQILGIARTHGIPWDGW